jgi:hypothetical protein
MFSFRLLLLAMAVLTSSCIAQTGTVTFYSVGTTMRGGVAIAVVPAGKEPFTGWLFDGKQRLAHAQSGHFMTFDLPAGPHSFSATYKSDLPGLTVLQLNVERNQHYCFRLSANYVNYIVLPIQHVDSRIDQVTCQQAFQEAGTSKPLSSKRVDATARGNFDGSATFPSAN